MASSVLEIEARRILASARDSLRTRDRAVVLALLLAVVPFPPSNAIALILSLLNILLIATGKLARANLGLVLAALVMSAVSSWIFVYVFGAMSKAALLQLAHLPGSLSALGAELRQLLDSLGGSGAGPRAPHYSDV